MSEEPPQNAPRREFVIPLENILIPLFFILCLSIALFLLRVTVGKKLALWLFVPVGFSIPVLIVGIGNGIANLIARIKERRNL